MKTIKMMNRWLLILLVTGPFSWAQTTDSEVPGDHFSLEGALELFKKSSSPEEFEKMLNTPDSHVNNLDLNGDGDIDYVRVIDRHEGNIYLFILQAIVSERESQDIAVIELEKLENGKAVLQITGDADIYGIETIIEPTEEVRMNAGTTTVTNVVNVWSWPAVQYVYSPYYTVWVSPWSWSYRPYWWSPWRPVAYAVYRPWCAPYRPYYSVCYSHRVHYAAQFYRPYRTTSYEVHNRHQAQVAHYRTNRENGRGRVDDAQGNDYNGSESQVNDRTRYEDTNTRSYQRERQERSSNGRQTERTFTFGRSQQQDHAPAGNDRPTVLERSWNRPQRQEDNRGNWDRRQNQQTAPSREMRSNHQFNGVRVHATPSVQPNRNSSGGGNNAPQRSFHSGGQRKAEGQRRGRD